MNLLLLVTHVEQGYVPSLRALAERELSTYEEQERVSPVWVTLPDEVWDASSAELPARQRAAALLAGIVHQYDPAELVMPIYICAGEDTPTPVLFALAQEVEEISGRLPALFGVKGDPQTLEVRRAPLRELPLLLRLLEGDIVVLLLDLWASREARDEGDEPDSSRGTRIRVVYRQVEDKGPEYFAGTYAAPVGSDLPVPLVLPWSLVVPLEEWQGTASRQEALGRWTAISRMVLGSPYGLMAWEVDVDERLQAREGRGPWVLPFFRGYSVDARLREFRSPTLSERIPFDSQRGKLLLLEMYASGASTASVPFDSQQGQVYAREMEESLQQQGNGGPATEEG